MLVKRARVLQIQKGALFESTYFRYKIDLKFLSLISNFCFR